MTHTYKNLVKKAEELHKNVTTKGKNGISDKWCYYFCKTIINKKKDVPVINIKDAADPIGESINQKLSKAEYTNAINRFASFVDKKKTIPNYIIIKNKKVHPKIFCAFVADILRVYNTKGELPASQTIKSDIYKKQDANKLYPYLINTGCSGMGQCTGYYCACNSLQQSFYRLTGIIVPESTIASWAGTTTSGTDHVGINTAVAQFNKKYNKKIKITWYNFSDLGKNDTERWTKIATLIKKGAVFCHLLYRRKYGHYEVIKVVDNPLKILNSLGSSCGGSTYCGYIENRTKSEQRAYINGISQNPLQF